MATITSFEELHCWQASRKVIRFTRMITKRMPSSERYDLVSNMNRAARSTTRNIAEGFGRHGHKENIQFCRISRGSLYELIDDLITCKEDNYVSESEYKEGRGLIDTAIRLVNGYIKYLSSRK